MEYSPLLICLDHGVVNDEDISECSNADVQEAVQNVEEKYKKHREATRRVGYADNVELLSEDKDTADNSDAAICNDHPVQEGVEGLAEDEDDEGDIGGQHEQGGRGPGGRAHRRGVLGPAAAVLQQDVRGGDHQPLGAALARRVSDDGQCFTITIMIESAGFPF